MLLRTRRGEGRPGSRNGPCSDMLATTLQWYDRYPGSIDRHVHLLSAGKEKYTPAMYCVRNS